MVWADDPEGLLFDKDDDTSDYSSGLTWYQHFKAGEKGDFSSALFHMIQDSFAHGHVERDSAGDIAEFHAYGSQDEHKHGEYDFLGGTKDEKLGDRVAKTMGAPSAIDRCADVLTMIAQGKSAGDIVEFLDETVFKLAASTKTAGPGAGLTRPVKPPPVKIDPQ